MTDYLELQGPGGNLNLKEKRRWEILRRTDCYRNDWEKTFRAFKELHVNGEPFWTPENIINEFIYMSDEGRELARKYDLVVPYYYDAELWNPLTDRRKSVFRDMWPVRVIAQGPEILKRGPDGRAIIGEDGLVTFDYTPHLRDGRFITIEIDLTATLQEIKDIVGSQARYYHEKLYGKSHKDRNKAINFYIDIEHDKKISIYKLWDMNKKERKSPWRIAQELYPSATRGKSYQGHRKNYDKEAKRIQEHIASSIKKANNEINSLMIQD